MEPGIYNRFAGLHCNTLSTTLLSPMITAGLYLHIPFCKIKCSYCDFYSVAERENTIPRFVQALIHEIDHHEIDVKDWQIDTVFIGGGTPSLIAPADMEKIWTALNDRFDLSNVDEITIEANPGEAPLESLRAFREMGINRLSMGIQSFRQDNLTFLSRIHSVDDVYWTFDHARQAGFDNINGDLILGIPGQSLADWKEDLRSLIDLEPTHISAYSLTVEKGTDLFHQVRQGQVTMPTDSVSADLYSQTQTILEQAGYPLYEISNYARPGYTCRHNLHYWHIDPYLAFGPSSHGFDGTRRWNNIRNLDGYLAAIEQGRSPIASEETLTETELINEKIGFGLRLAEGLNLGSLPEKIRIEIYSALPKIQDKWNGCLNINNDLISLTAKGRCYADAIAVEVMRF